MRYYPCVIREVIDPYYAGDPTAYLGRFSILTKDISDPQKLYFFNLARIVRIDYNYQLSELEDIKAKI